MSGRRHAPKHRGDLKRAERDHVAPVPRKEAVSVVRGRVVGKRVHLTGTQTLTLDNGTVLRLPRALALSVRPPNDHVTARVTERGRVIEVRPGGWHWPEREEAAAQ